MPATPHSADGPRIEPPVVRPGAAQDQPRRHRSARAGRRPGGEAVDVPRVARRRPRQVEARAAKGELVRRQLAQHHRPSLGELADRGGVRVRHPALQQLGVRRRRDAGRAVDVLVRDRDAVQGAAPLAPHDPGLGRPRVGERPFRRHQDEAVQRCVLGGDAVQAVLRQLDRGERARGDLLGGLGDGGGLHHDGSGRKTSAGSASRPRPSVRIRASIGSIWAQPA